MRRPRSTVVAVVLAAALLPAADAVAATTRLSPNPPGPLGPVPSHPHSPGSPAGSQLPATGIESGLEALLGAGLLLAGTGMRLRSRAPGA